MRLLRALEAHFERAILAIILFALVAILAAQVVFRYIVEEAQQADEAFVTSASSFVMPVVELDGAKIGAGTPGPVAARLREIYLEESMKVAV